MNKLDAPLSLPLSVAGGAFSLPTKTPRVHTPRYYGYSQLLGRLFGIFDAERKPTTIIDL